MRGAIAVRRTAVAAAALALAAVVALDVSGAPAEQAKLIDEDADADETGYSVALAGGTAVVGSSGSPGAAYVFTRSGTNWTQEAKLTADDAVNGDHVGDAVAVAGDTAVVGAPAGNGSPGAAYVFTRTGTTWTQQAKLAAEDGADGDLFARSVAIAGDTVVVGAQQVGLARGAAYVFTRTGTTWTQEARLEASDVADAGYFGIAVALSGDRAAIGGGGAGSNGKPGAIYVFKRTGTTWAEEAKLTPSDGVNGDHFGEAVALAGDTAVAGASFKNAFRGAAYVFTRSGTTWTQQAKLTASDAVNDDSFGTSVAVADGTVVAGAWGKNSCQGAAYVFSRTGTTWTQGAKLTASDPASVGEFGWSVALAGGAALVGAPASDDGEGAAYVFTGVGTAAPPPPPPPIDSFFLPKTVKAKFNAAAPGQSALTAVGILDTGSGAPDLASAATLDVGGLHFDIAGLTQSGKKFAFTGGGATFSITPNPYGSSRAKFKLTFKGSLAGKVALNGPLDLYFDNAVTDGGGTVELDGGAFGLGKVAGSLVQPNLFVVRAHANLKGPGKDALAVIVGLATGGATPPAATDLTIGFGANVTATIPAASFVRKGTTDTFTGNAGGITKVVVDYAREQISVTGKALTLETFVQGGNPVLLTVGLGADVRAVLVRMGRIGNTMKY